jgi:hypothetical protein
VHDLSARAHRLLADDEHERCEMQKQRSSASKPNRNVDRCHDEMDPSSSPLSSPRVSKQSYLLHAASDLDGAAAGGGGGGGEVLNAGLNHDGIPTMDANSTDEQVGCDEW